MYTISGTLQLTVAFLFFKTRDFTGPSWQRNGFCIGAGDDGASDLRLSCRAQWRTQGPGPCHFWFVSPPKHGGLPGHTSNAPGVTKAQSSESAGAAHRHCDSPFRPRDSLSPPLHTRLTTLEPTTPSGPSSIQSSPHFEPPLFRKIPVSVRSRG